MTNKDKRTDFQQFYNNNYNTEGMHIYIYIYTM